MGCQATRRRDACRLLRYRLWTTGQASPTKVRQTIVGLRDGKLMSLLTEPDLGTSRAEALSGGTIDLFKDVMIRSAA